MKMMELIRAMERIAPTELAEAWDNPGLLVGDPRMEVRGVALCVDATPAAVERAASLGADAIVSHHPLMFSAVRAIRGDDYEGALLTELVRQGIALYAAHTNLDRAPGGVEDSLAAALGIDVDAQEGYLRAGRVQPCAAGEWLEQVRQTLSPQAVFYGDPKARIERVAASCGAGGSYFRQAHRMGAQLFLTGEMMHHERIEAQGLGMQVILAGHEETERVALEPLCRRLAGLLPEEIPVHIIA